MFLPNEENKPQVNHKNGIKNQNIVNPDDLYGETTNLEWATNSENQIHAYKLGLNYNTEKQRQNTLISNKKRTKKVRQYSFQGEVLKEWDSIKEAGLQLNICPNSICACCKGKVKTAGGYHWKYKNT